MCFANLIASDVDEWKKSIVANSASQSIDWRLLPVGGCLVRCRQPSVRSTSPLNGCHLCSFPVIPSSGRFMSEEFVILIEMDHQQFLSLSVSLWGHHTLPAAPPCAVDWKEENVFIIICLVWSWSR